MKMYVWMIEHDDQWWCVVLQLIFHDSWLMNHVFLNFDISLPRTKFTSLGMQTITQTTRQYYTTQISTQYTVVQVFKQQQRYQHWQNALWLNFTKQSSNGVLGWTVWCTCTLKLHTYITNIQTYISYIQLANNSFAWICGPLMRQAQSSMSNMWYW